MARRGNVFEDRETAQRFTVLEMGAQILIVYDHGAKERRTINRILWEADVQAGTLRRLSREEEKRV